MTSVAAVDNYNASKLANYNAVKIMVNDPKTNIAEGFTPSENDNGIYNGVSIEVNRPSVDVGKKETKVYDYPQAENLVTYDMAVIQPVSVPEIKAVPLAYEEAHFVVEELPEENLEEAEVVLDSEEPVEEEAGEAKKKITSDINFNGVSFKSVLPETGVDVVAPVEVKPTVNAEKVIANLRSEDFDTQAKQMEEIAKAAMKSPEEAVGYINKEVFTALIDIVEKDSVGLQAPSEKQIELRKQIIINEIIKEQASKNGEDIEKIELPYQLTENEIKEAVILSPMEQAERNKEYALYSLAILAKVYADDVEKSSGNVVPLTDLPGSAVFADTLKRASNPSVKIAAMDALRYIHRPEYKNEITTLLLMATKDENHHVAKNAQLMLESI